MQWPALVAIPRDSSILVHADILEPVRTAVLLVQPGLAVGETARHASLALVRVGAVEEGDVLVSDIAEPVEKKASVSSTTHMCASAIKHLPVDLALILKQTESNAVYGSITPSLVEETAGSVQVVKVVLVRLAAPKVHVANLKVAPEVAGRVSVGIEVVAGAASLIGDPVQRVVRVKIIRVLGNELDRLGPQRRDRLGGIVEVDGEAVRLVVVVHITEHVVVNVAEKVDVGLNAPIVLRVVQSRVLVEQATVPSTHLVVRDLVGVLDAVLLEDLDRLLVKVVVDPRRDLPVLVWDKLYSDAMGLA
jgi:hypothetical protein